MKKFVSTIIAIIIFITSVLCINVIAFADDDNFIQIGDSDTYYYYNEDTATLTIKGEGETPNLSNSRDSVPWYDYRANIKKAVIEEGITTLGDYLLYNTGITEIELPSTLKKLSKYSLAYSKLESIELPFGFTTIDSYSFYSCATINSITLPKTLQTIGVRAFHACANLKNITIPACVKSIGSYAFNGCTSLSDVTFSSMTMSVTIGSNAFTQCSSLKNIAVPINTSCSNHFFGYKDTKNLYSDISMSVYDGTNSQAYAQASSIPYTVFDTIQIECGIEYSNIYTDDNVNDTFHYVFKADNTEAYNFYTLGDTDVKAELYLNGVLIAENDDISQSNTNFCITANLQKNSVYDLYVRSVKKTGEYSLFVYPDAISSFDVKGELNFSASEVTTDDAKTHLNVTDDMVSDFILTVYFADGTSDMMYYPNTYFDAKDVKLVDNSSLSCGANNCEIIIGDIVSTYNVNITHSYAEKDVEPTPDEDGYTLHYCILCNEGCKDNFVQTTSFTVYGNCVLAETPFNEHSIDLPYDKATIRVDGREYSINSDGTWEIHTFDSCTIVFDNPYGNNMTIRVSIDNSDVNYGTIVLCGYDLNQDGHINAKDYVLYKRDYKNEFSKDYFRFIEEFLIYY